MFDFRRDVLLTTHKCNETDRNILFQNFDYVDVDTFDKYWSNYNCLDNPELINMRHGNSKYKK